MQLLNAQLASLFLEFFMMKTAETELKRTRAPSKVFNCLSFTISWPVSTSLKFGAKFFSNPNAGALLLGGYFPVGTTTENVNFKK